MAGEGPNLYTIPAGAPFLQSLAAAMLRGDLPTRGAPPNPFELAGYTLYLPTRRACLAMRHAFLDASQCKAVLLPRIRPLGEIDDEALLLPTSATEDASPIATQPGVMDPLERRLVLTSLVLDWLRRMAAMPPADAVNDPMFAAATPASACTLAGDLARLLDEAASEGVDLRRLAGFAEGRFASHWQLTLDFLDIIAKAWPRYLRDSGSIDPVARRNERLLAEAERLRREGSVGPVIIAGSTGSIPATAALMRAVLSLGNGAVVLPGLDPDMDEADWQGLGETRPDHPQTGLKLLLDRLGLPRGQVRILSAEREAPVAGDRRLLLREAFRLGLARTGSKDVPALAPQRAASALEQVSLIEAATPAEEAAVIALIVRRAAEEPGRSVAVITPDRQLAERVCRHLETWGITLSHSGGTFLTKTQAGAYLELVLDAVHGGGVALLALLKHPATRLGLPEGEAARAGERLDLALLREPGADFGLDGLRDALKRVARGGGMRHDAIERLTPEDWQLMRTATDRLTECCRPLLRLKREERRLGVHADAHLATALALTAGEDGEGASAPLWRGEDGAAALRFLGRLADEALPGPHIVGGDYPDLFRALIAGETVGQTYSIGGLSIGGPLEARLHNADTLVLAGLNEGCWPEPADPGPWLNRAARAGLGLLQPERRIGQAAHDFCQAFCAGEVFLTRSLKADGSPTVPSRWLMRLKAVLECVSAADALTPAAPWLDWARLPHRVADVKPAPAPQPCPPLRLRPRKLSVTEAVKLMANPYAIYAEKILRLKPLPPLCSGPLAHERGSIIHEALSEFTRRHPHTLPQDVAAALLEAADAIMERRGAHTAMLAFWRPRLARFAAWFGETEPARRAGVAAIAAEIRGRITFEAPGGPFELTGRADRVDLLEDGALAIYDYKSGAVPGQGKVMDGRAPQLPLEAYIALEGGFGAALAMQTQPRIAKLAYIAAKGGEPAGVQTAIQGDLDALARETGRKFIALVCAFDRESRPYPALRRALFSETERYDNYAHLARFAEWLIATAEEEAT